MNVYIFDADVNNYRGLYLNAEGVMDFMRRFNGKPIKRSWTTEQRLKFVPRFGPKGDCPNLGSHVPVFNSEAVKVLADLLKSNGELLPAICDKEKYFLFNVTRILDALDEDNCELDRFDDGRVMDIDRYSFFEKKLTGAVIFKIPQRLLSLIYVTDPFVNRVKTAGLLGFKFRLIWTSEQLQPETMNTAPVKDKSIIRAIENR